MDSGSLNSLLSAKTPLHFGPCDKEKAIESPTISFKLVQKMSLVQIGLEVKLPHLCACVSLLLISRLETALLFLSLFNRLLYSLLLAELKPVIVPPPLFFPPGDIDASLASAQYLRKTNVSIVTARYRSF